MREIKFRGIRIDNNEFFKGFVVRTSEKMYILEEWHLPEIWGNKHFNDLEHYKVHENSIGQFTGLKYKNGVEIYEGDILKWNNSRHMCVRFIDGGFWGCLKINENTDSYLHPSYFEIVGNIHQNPELLK
jgi:uncharacterized phage protein (TIGR01671 family)